MDILADFGPSPFLRHTKKEGTSSEGYMEGVLERGTWNRRRVPAICEIMAKKGGKAAKIARRLDVCGSYLGFGEYYRAGETRLLDANFCGNDKLCVFCASRRSGKLAGRYLDRVQTVWQEGFRLFHVVLTCQDGLDLAERVKTLKEGFQRVLRRCRDVLKKGRGRSPWVNVVGGVRSLEVGRGRDSGWWHPHLHILCIVAGPFDFDAVRREWLDEIGQADGWGWNAQYCGAVDARGDEGVTGAFIEVFKYAVKLGELSPADAVTAWDVLQGVHLVQPWGILWGVQVPASLADDPLGPEEPYIMHLFKWIDGRYSKMLTRAVEGKAFDWSEGTWRNAQVLRDEEGSVEKWKSYKRMLVNKVMDETERKEVSRVGV